MISVTERAARQVRRHMEQQATAGESAAAGLRLGVRGGGCAGLEYVMELAPGPRPDDRVLEFHGLTVFLDPRSLAVLDETELDFNPGLEDHGFQWRNAREQSRCGCGQSFRSG